MTRFDRYMLSQFMVLFGFFALVLVSIFWINKAVRMFDRLLEPFPPERNPMHIMYAGGTS